ncbi:MAG: hypothetical protein J6Y31_02265 [Bacteroidales bacterium]|nr:hypothetical protein [Bacteroidales bacterium]
MKGKLHTVLAAAAVLLCIGQVVVAQVKKKREDNLVRLISAKSAQLIDQNGQNYRKVVGPAKFLHNDTYLLCDTALWNVNTNIIDAIGHVRIIQDRTKLSSATLQYIVDENMAKFRGDLVQLEDKDGNILRTRYLDYNTKDSVAIFHNGAAMRDKDGQVMESMYGTYDSKARLFVFNDQVNMYMDTTFVKTSRLEYRSDLSTAYFGYGTDMWQNKDMLSANDGWYDRSRELFFFRRKVHMMTEDQETWSDSLWYWRDRRDVEMRGSVELMDTTRNVYALAGRFVYSDGLSQIRMTREPAIMSVTEEKGRRDSLYLGADTLIYRSIKRCDIPEPWITDAAKRLEDISGDPIMEYRRTAAEEAAKAAEEAAKNDPNRPPFPAKGKAGKPANEAAGGKADAPGKAPAPAPEAGPSPKAPADSSGTSAQGNTPPPDVPPAPDGSPVPPADSSAIGKAPADTSATQEPPKDSTKIAFLEGINRVRLFRKDMQMACDSLTYSDLDSLIRLFRQPIFYNEGDRQYAADSIYMVVKNNRIEKANLLSNAFITIQEDPVSFDQIRGAEMVAYFDSTSVLQRFDALGGASTLFYLVENDVLATVNRVDSKMIYATFKDGDIERMYYYDNPTNDGYPTVQLPEEDRQLKGFRWDPEIRPKSPADVTSLKPRASERTSYRARPHTEFKQTDIYFPGYIKKLYRDIAIRDSLAVEREHAAALARAAAADSAKRAVLADSTATAPPDSLDTLTQPADSSMAAAADSLSKAAAVDEKDLTPAQIKAREKERKAAIKAEKKARKQAEREARWAEQDMRYEQRQAAKAQRKLEKQRARKLKALRRLERKSQREKALFEKYLKKAKEKLKKKK